MKCKHNAMVCLLAVTQLVFAATTGAKMSTLAKYIAQSKMQSKLKTDIEGGGNHLDLVMIFDTGVEKDYREVVFPAEELSARVGRLELMTGDLANALDQGVPVIAPDHLIKNIILLGWGCPSYHGIIDRSQWDKLSEVASRSNACTNPSGKAVWDKKLPEKLMTRYNVYRSKDAQLPLTLLLPATYEPAKFGINMSALNLLPPEQIIPTYLNLYTQQQQINEIKKPINIDSLRTWFLMLSKIPKRVFLSGHGNIGIIAQLHKKEYVDFLKLNNDIGTEILVISSCYSGGGNLAQMHSFTPKKANEETDELLQKETLKVNDEWLQDVKAINFIIAINSISDIESMGNLYFGTTNRHELSGATQLQFDSFFEEMDKYFKGTGNLGKALSYVSGNTLQNLSSVRFPGSQGYFRPAILEKNMDTITFAKLQKSKIEAQFASMERYASLKMPKNHVITIGSSKKVLLLYPPLIDVPIKIMSQDPICIVSMVSGDSIHMINELVAPNMDIYKLIASFGGVGSDATKVFIIKTPGENHKQQLLEQFAKCELAKKFSGSLSVEHVFIRYYQSTQGELSLRVLVLCKDSEGNLGVFTRKPPRKGFITGAAGVGQDETFVHKLLGDIHNQDRDFLGGAWELVVGPISPEKIKNSDPEALAALENFKGAMNVVIEQYAPTPDAIKQATGGHQTLEMLKEGIVNMLNNYVGSIQWK